MSASPGIDGFVPGLLLSERFYREAVRPVLERRFPGLPHAAGLLGTGSEVLGFDTPRSADHEWGPRVLLVLPVETAAIGPRIVEQLRWSLPRTFLGYPVNFGAPNEEGTRWMTPAPTGPVEHKVTVTTLERLLEARLGVTSVNQLTPLDWLLFSEQALLEVTAGAIFHDGPGAITAARNALAYYPDEVWRYLLAAQWMRISQQEPFVGRTGEVGDELGSRVIVADLVRDVMRLAFLLERRYAPYGKWLGTAFARLASAPRLMPYLDAALRAPTWPEREAAIGRAYEIAAVLQNELGLAEPQPAALAPFHDRPFRIIHGERFAAALLASIRDERVRGWPPYVGSVDQFVDSTDVLSRSRRRVALRALYEA